MNCELCGKHQETLNQTTIEGVSMKVCMSCKNLGKPTPRVERMQKNNYEMPKETRLIVKNYALLIKNARERQNLKHLDLAKELGEKESTLQQVESGKLKPTFKLAQKLERTFSIKLIEQYTEDFELKKSEKTEFTIGDMIKIKTRSRK
jgi:uncharacterized protein (TIGR00270 family)